MAETVEQGRTEIVFGLVGAVGTNLGWVTDELERHLKRFSYAAETIRLSALAGLALGAPSVDSSSEFTRISTAMNAGNAARQKAYDDTKRHDAGDALARFAVVEIAKRRGDSEALRPGVGYVLRSLKHPHEVALLRRVYGPGFFLIGVYADEEDRLSRLERLGMNADEARELDRRDAAEASALGQRTRDTFAEADMFLKVEDDGSVADRKELERFVDLVFGDPHKNPTREEYAMFLAYAASLRSADLSRQVGAAIVNIRGDVLSVGANDVPKAGGGLHWPDPDDRRDYVLGYDFNERERERISEEIADLLPKNIDKDTVDKFRRDLKKTRLFDITEYGRPVHAEMEALLACGRIGVSTDGAELFVTTFPCHNCAKHIIGAGIKRVVFVEPYPKSRATDMYSEEILVSRNVPHENEKKVVFTPFFGVGARRYTDLFSMGWGTGIAIRRKQKDAKGEKVAWDRAMANPRVPMLASHFLNRENEVVEEISGNQTKANTEGDAP